MAVELRSPVFKFYPMAEEVYRLIPGPVMFSKFDDREFQCDRCGEVRPAFCNFECDTLDKCSVCEGWTYHRVRKNPKE